MSYDGSGPYVVWSEHGLDVWNPRSVSTFEDAVKVREEELGNCARQVVITKLVKVEIKEVTE